MELAMQLRRTGRTDGVCENERRVAKRQIPRGGIREDRKK